MDTYSRRAASSSLGRPAARPHSTRLHVHPRPCPVSSTSSQRAPLAGGQLHLVRPRACARGLPRPRPARHSIVLFVTHSLTHSHRHTLVCTLACIFGLPRPAAPSPHGILSVVTHTLSALLACCGLHSLTHSHALLPLLHSCHVPNLRDHKNWTFSSGSTLGFSLPV